MQSSICNLIITIRFTASSNIPVLKVVCGNACKSTHSRRNQTPSEYSTKPWRTIQIRQVWLSWYRIRCIFFLRKTIVFVVSRHTIHYQIWCFSAAVTSRISKENESFDKLDRTIFWSGFQKRMSLQWGALLDLNFEHYDARESLICPNLQSD